MLKTGDPFPEFSLANQDGKTRSLRDFAGKWLVLYVYPKDDTPGCTIQGQSFTRTRASVFAWPPQTSSEIPRLINNLLVGIPFSRRSVCADPESGPSL